MCINGDLERKKFQLINKVKKTRTPKLDSYSRRKYYWCIQNAEKKIKSENFIGSKSEMSNIAITI